MASPFKDSYILSSRNGQNLVAQLQLAIKQAGR